MGIKTYNPYTPSRRNMTGSDFSEITKTTPEKSLLTSLKKNAGRNNQGKITVRHHGGGNRRKYRLIDFKRNKDGIPATVIGEILFYGSLSLAIWYFGALPPSDAEHLFFFFVGFAGRNIVEFVWYSVLASVKRSHGGG